MGTVVINTENANAYASGLTEAATALRQGKLVIFPTETVYGVAANATDTNAVQRLRVLKNREDRKPFTVHLGQRTHARRFLSDPSPLAQRLMRKAWPGPLTLICEEPHPEKTQVGSVCSVEQLEAIYHAGTVGLRCPDHAAANRFLSEADVPTIASSANRAGKAPPLDLHEALSELDGLVDYAIDAGPTRHNTASTIVEVRGNEWTIHRAGAIDERSLRRMARSEVLFVCTGNSCRSPMAEYLFRHALANKLGLTAPQLEAAGYVVSSAGVAAADGAPASSGAYGEMKDRGIDMAGHRSQPLTVELAHRAEKIYTMSPEHRQAVLDIAPAAARKTELLDPNGPVSDPIGGSTEVYHACAEQIHRLIQKRLEEFLHEDRDWQ